MELIKVKKTAEAKLPTKYGEFRIFTFKSSLDDRTQIVLQKGKIKKSSTLVRLHSKCFTGDVLSSLKCDCQQQLNLSLKKIGKEGGVLIYLNQEGRDIGLENKIKAYALQDKGLDTVDANLDLGLQPDPRDYKVAISILKFLKIKQVRLLTNNPDKIDQLRAGGIKVVKRLSIEIKPNKFNKFYLKTKKIKMGHQLKSV